MSNIIYMDSPLGSIGIVEKNEKITNLFFAEAESIQMDGIAEAETPLLLKAKCQLEEYFLGKRKKFDLPLDPQGTDFMKRDWDALLKVPYGETRSYKDIAVALGNPKACRAVGLANNRNPIAIVIPCHRIIGADGKLVGYAGGLHLKKYLLELEGIKC